MQQCGQIFAKGAYRTQSGAHPKKGTKMYTNDLNNAYIYESERRKDEMRAAMESQLLRGLGGKPKVSLPLPMAIIGILATLIVVIRVF